MMGGMGIFEFPAMIEPDGSMENLIVAVTGVVITMAVAFVICSGGWHGDGIVPDSSCDWHCIGGRRGGTDSYWFKYRAVGWKRI